MESSSIHQYRVQPHPLLSLIKPLVFEPLLADRAHVVDATACIRRRYVGWSRCLGGFSSFVSRCLDCRRNLIRIDNLPGLKPVLQTMLVTIQLDTLMGQTYLLIDIPAAVHSALLSLVTALMDLKVPVHMRRLLLLALVVSLETTTTLRAGRS